MLTKRKERAATSSLALLFIVMMLAGTERVYAQDRESLAPLLEGMGDYHRPITTDDPMAQRFFDQGLVLAYAFNHAEAKRSFKEAVRHDPDCAMCHWGIALVVGPNINAAMNPADAPEAYAAVQRARALAEKATEKERAYIQALAKRYVEDPPEDRGALDQAYADAMREVVRRYPDDMDAQTLFAEALMDTTPWDYWTEEGEPKAVTRELLATLEAVMEDAPDHPGANHLYIHAVEAVQPERAIATAERLEDLVPGAGHLVHMPSHIYIRVGRYDDAVRANERAVAADEGYLTQCRMQGFYPLLYYPHNIHFLWFAAMMAGQEETAIGAARNIQSRLSDAMIESQRLRPALLFALLRFGRWEDILAQPTPPEDQLYARAMWHYGQGMALLRTGRSKAARGAADQLRRVAESEAAQELEQPFFYGASQIAIAHELLEGELAGAEGDTEQIVRHIEEAVRLQDELPYMEPPYWYYPVRQSLGAALLEAGRYEEAEEVFRADLRHFAENGWSLFGLAQSLRAQGKIEAAEEVQKRFDAAWQGADVTLTSSRF